MEKQIENLKSELQKIGIWTDQDLRDAIGKLPPLKLHIMTGVIRKQKGAENGSERECNLCG